MPAYKPRHSLRKGKFKEKGFHKNARHHRDVLRRLINSHGGLCAYCLRQVTLDVGQPTSATIDHLVPRSKGGGEDLGNLRLACRRCNAEKGSEFGLDCGLDECQ